MTGSVFSQEVSGVVPAAAPAAPVIASVSMVDRKATVAVTLPTVDVDGVGLAVPLTKVFVYYKQASFAGSTPATEDAAGTPKAEVDAGPAAAPTEVAIDGLERGKTYYFVACVE